MTPIPLRLRPFNLLFELPTANANHSSHFQWHCDRELLRNIESHLVVNPTHTPETLIYQMLLTLKEDPNDLLTRRHLYAFLSHIAERVVQKIRVQFEGMSAFKADRVGFIQDLLQDVLEDLLDPVYFFRNFDPNHFENPALRYAALRSYCRKRIKGNVFDCVRKKPGMTDFMRSNLGLTRRSSQKIAVAAMEYVGHPTDRIAQYSLAKKCLNEHHKSVKLDIDQYTALEFQQVADRYNQLLPRLEIRTASTIDSQTIKIYLEEIGAAIRKFGARFNNPQSLIGQDGETIELEIPDPSGTTAYELSEQQERQAQSNQIKDFLTTCLTALTPETSRIPLLMHGLSLVQTKIATELDKNQSTIARNYQKLIAELTEKLANWSESAFQIPKTSELLQILQDPIEEHLKWHYVQVVYAEFKTALNASPPILTALTHLIQTQINLTLKPNGFAIDSLRNFIQKYSQS